VANNKIKNFTLFDICNYAFLSVVALTMIYPFWNQLCMSFSSPAEVLRGGFILLPRKFSTETYAEIIVNSSLWQAYRNSIFTTVMHMILGVFFTALTAYPLSRKTMRGRKLLTKFVLFTMLFSGGMIPTYLVVNGIGLVNSLWALIIPGLITGYNVMITKSFFQSLPDEIEESAYIDGANPLQIFFRIIIPLSKPVLATIALWIAVGPWNNFMGALIYLNKRPKFTLPVFVMDILQGTQQATDLNEVRKVSFESLKAATIMLTVVPIICTYPFLQKYFVKGVMIGAIKG